MTLPPARRAALVVETNYLLASVVEVSLASAGYEVLIATDVDEAFELIDSFDFSLALIDFRLSHGEPEGLVAVLERRHIPFMFCTAATEEEVQEHFPNARVMLKPFSDEQLLAAVEAAMDSSDA
jgi:DNA-binding response OmpR family regulator